MLACSHGALAGGVYASFLLWFSEKFRQLSIRQKQYEHKKRTPAGVPFLFNLTRQKKKLKVLLHLFV
jgi:hypothetical protein